MVKELSLIFLRVDDNAVGDAFSKVESHQGETNLALTTKLSAF